MVRMRVRDCGSCKAGGGLSIQQRWLQDWISRFGRHTTFQETTRLVPNFQSYIAFKRSNEGIQWVHIDKLAGLGAWSRLLQGRHGSGSMVLNNDEDDEEPTPWKWLTTFRFGCASDH